jgi:hypothetical protein
MVSNSRCGMWRRNRSQTRIAWAWHAGTAFRSAQTAVVRADRWRRLPASPNTAGQIIRDTRTSTPRPPSTTSSPTGTTGYRPPGCGGDGTFAFSDGQRFPVQVKAANAGALPRYFGFGWGLSVLTSVTDHYATFGTKVIPTRVREWSICSG